MLDCLLINAPADLSDKQYSVDPKVPLGLLHIAAVLTESGYTVKIFDCHTQCCGVSDVISFVQSSTPRLVGINISTPNRRVVFELLNAIKSSCAGTPVIAGGPHATSFPEDIFANVESLDAVVIGEGEFVVRNIMQSLQRIPEMDGVYLREDFVSRRPRRPASRIIDLDALPFPDFDLINTQKYISVSPELYISASRGCVYNCAFCSTRTLLGSRVIGRSAIKVIYEMLSLRKKYGVHSFYFFDENILLWSDFDRFCVEASGLGIRWTAHGTLNDVKGVESVKRLAASGCYRLSFGFESGATKLQKYMAKVIKDKSLCLLPEFQAAGVETRGYFVVGVPEETIDDFVETLFYLLRLRNLGLTDVVVFPARPYPGTRLFKDCVNRFGEKVIAQLLDFTYLEDWKHEEDKVLSEKRRKYDTMSKFQINENFQPLQVRELTSLAIEVFFNAEHYASITHQQMCDIVLKTLADSAESGRCKR